ncbi:MAG: VTT domain-containing protein [Cyclobacteriaceae bacterium]|nr:VTT domain-containing protein [Cyclobacteriaceae bacterium]
MQTSPQEETKSGFLLRNLLKGLVWFAVIITAYILLQSEIEVYEHEIARLGNKLGLLLSIFTLSEIVFGIIPPEVFMFIWRGGEMSQYIINLSLLTFISYGAGVLGYYIGYTFSKTGFYQKIHARYLQQYDRQLKKYGGYLVLVGAVTPVPFSATCMMAGSVHLNFKNFLLICISRILRFAVYGWMVWQFPNWFIT